MQGTFEHSGTAERPEVRALRAQLEALERRYQADRQQDRLAQDGLDRTMANAILWLWTCVAVLIAVTILR